MSKPKTNPFAVRRVKSGSVWRLDNEEGVSASRAIAVTAMLALGMDPGDWRTRDKLILKLHPQVDGMLDHVQTAEREGDVALDELNRQLSVALKGKRPYSSQFADDTIAAQATRIAELEEKLNGWFAEKERLTADLKLAQEQLFRAGDEPWAALGCAQETEALLRDKLSACFAALDLIASPMRPDGTHNRDREACGVIAREVIKKIQ